MRFQAPHPALSGVVGGAYCGYVEDAVGPFRRREAATGHVTLILNLAGPLDLVEMSNSSSAGSRLTSFVAGLHEGYAVTEHRGDQCGIEVELTPIGAGRLLGAPEEVANEVVALDDLLGPAARRAHRAVGLDRRLGRAVRARRPGAARTPGRLPRPRPRCRLGVGPARAVARAGAGARPRRRDRLEPAPLRRPVPPPGGPRPQAHRSGAALPTGHRPPGERAGALDRRPRGGLRLRRPQPPRAASSTRWPAAHRRSSWPTASPTAAASRAEPRAFRRRRSHSSKPLPGRSRTVDP